MQNNELQPIIFKKGILNNELFNLIAFNNEGNKEYNLEEIKSYCECKVCEYPNTLKDAKFTHVSDELIIMENGKDVTVIIRKVN